MKRAVLCTICLLLISGCTGHAWYNPNKTFEECERAFAMCLEPNLEEYRTPIPVLEFDPLYSTFHTRYYDHVSHQATWGTRRRCEACMRARGYKLVPVEQLPAGVKQHSAAYGDLYDVWNNVWSVFRKWDTGDVVLAGSQ